MTILPTATLLTTQEAVDILGVSRPTVMKILEAGEMPFLTPRVRAVLDACVLIPRPLADTLLHRAEGGLFEPIWSAELLDETRRNLSKLGVSPERAARRVELMQKAFPWSAAEPPARLIEAMTVHET